MTQAKYKRALYKVESNFAEAYDKTANMREFKLTDDFALEIMGEKGETVYLAKDRKLNAQSQTLRKTGKFTVTKNLDLALLDKHSEIMGYLGEVLGGTVGEKTISASSTTSNITTLTVGEDLSALVGLPVIIAFQDGTFSNQNIVESADATTVTLKFPLTTANEAKIANGDKLVDTKYLRISAPQNSKTFQFVIEHDDDTVTVLRGCAPKITMPFNKEGKATVNFEFMAAIAEEEDELGTLHEQVTGTITSEGVNQKAYYNFQLGYVSDLATSPAPTFKMPQQFALNIAHELSPDTLQGGANNIAGWLPEANITAEANFSRVASTITLFSKRNEGNAGQYFFMSQQDILFYAPIANFTNDDSVAHNSFDSKHYNVDVNHSTDSEPILVIPQTITATFA